MITNLLMDLRAFVSSSIQYCTHTVVRCAGDAGLGDGGQHGGGLGQPGRDGRGVGLAPPPAPPHGAHDQGGG